MAMNTDTLFTPGPVMIDQASLELGGRQMVYHRTADFSATILNGNRMIKMAAGAATADQVVILTGSGTAAMEAAVPGCRVTIVNNGTRKGDYISPIDLFDVREQVKSLDEVGGFVHVVPDTGHAMVQIGSVEIAPPAAGVFARAAAKRRYASPVSTWTSGARTTTHHGGSAPSAVVTSDSTSFNAVCAARPRVVEPLEHEDAGALRHHEAVAADIEGTACGRRIVVALRHRANDCEGAEDER